MSGEWIHCQAPCGVGTSMTPHTHSRLNSSTEAACASGEFERQKKKKNHPKRQNIVRQAGSCQTRGGWSEACLCNLGRNEAVAVSTSVCDLMPSVCSSKNNSTPRKSGAALSGPTVAAAQGGQSGNQSRQGRCAGAQSLQAEVQARGYGSFMGA